MTRMAWGAGFTTEAADGTTLDAWFRWLGWGELGTEAPEEVDVALAGGDRTDPTRRVTIRPIRLTVDVDAPPASAADVYLRLHLLSHRLTAAALGQPRRRLRPAQHRRLDRPRPGRPGRPRRRSPGPARRGPGADDPQPRQVPADDRLRRPRQACASPTPTRVRLGAHLADGTVVMHEGFCNFNAGTLGTSMVEGRISQGVIVGDGSDIGGGSSIMGTLSGGGTEQVTDRRALPARRQRRDRHQPRRRLRRRGRPLRHRRHARRAARRQRRQGQGAVGHQRDDVHPPQPDRRRRGPPAQRLVGRPQRRPARQLNPFCPSESARSGRF